MVKTGSANQRRLPRKAAADAAFSRVIEALGADPEVHFGESKGFGSGALKVKGKIFAMICSKGKFVAKLPRARVDQLVRDGTGDYFDPAGRPMKQWIAISGSESLWIALAKEARDFVATQA